MKKLLLACLLLVSVQAYAEEPYWHSLPDNFNDPIVVVAGDPAHIQDFQEDVKIYVRHGYTFSNGVTPFWGSDGHMYITLYNPYLVKPQ